MAKRDLFNLEEVLTSKETLASLDDLYGKGSQDYIQDIPLEKLRDYERHTFKVRDDKDMQVLVSSIEEHGLAMPILVRKIEGTDEYEIISGHRRKHAVERLGYNSIKCIVKKLSDADADLMMANTNLKQRTRFLPSEKARTYALISDALKQKPGRKKADESEPGAREKSVDAVAREVEDSATNVKRYLRLLNLLPELLEMVDSRKIPFTTASELGLMKKDSQQLVLSVIKDDPSVLTGASLKMLRKAEDEGALTEQNAKVIIFNEGKDKRKIRAKDSDPVIIVKESEADDTLKRLRKHVPEYVPEEHVEEYILRALKEFKPPKEYADSLWAGDLENLED